MALSGIKARITFDKCVRELCAIGLLNVRQITGEHEGNEYTVFLPEERAMADMASLASTTSMTSHTSHAYKIDRLDRLENSQTSHTLSVETTDTSDDPKTLLKTNTEKDDDEAFARFAAVFAQAVRDITGKPPHPSEAERWGELAELLATELRIAAGRTTVSSVPAFLTEHLRRRLWKKEKRQLEAEPAVEAKMGAERPDVSACPDCYGTGMYYPEGFERGVARCAHEKLAAKAAEETGDRGAPA
jgi:hypothetical protein